MDISQAKYQGIGTNVRTTGWEMATHFHPFHEMVVVAKGTQHVQAGEAYYTAGPGDMLLYAAGVGHHEWSLPDTHLETYFFSFELPGVEARGLLHNHDRNGRVRQMVRWLLADRERTEPLVLGQRDALVGAVLAEFFREPGKEEDELVTYIRNYVRAHIAEPLALDVLARQANMSKFHFLREYKARCGRTPMEEVRSLRADCARDLILSTGLPFKDIAPRAGLGTEYAMCRLFRQLYNTTPGELRRFAAAPGRRP